MSQSEIERLIGDLSTDDALRDRLGSVGDGFDAALAAVRDAGYGIEADEARAYLAALSAGTRRELDDKDLDAVTGGKIGPYLISGLESLMKRTESSIPAPAWRSGR